MYAKDCYPGLKVGRLTLQYKVKWKPRTCYVIGWHCKCDCGNELNVRTNSIGHPTVSCGCYNNDRIHEHKYADRDNIKGTPYYHLYRVFCAMQDRCYSVSAKDYPNYGGRGIQICDKWHNNYLVFKKWALSTGYDYHKKGSEQSLDRIDVNKNYSPDNCRWVNMKVQANNKTNTVRITYKGETRTITGWAEYLGIDRDLINSRYKEGYRDYDLFRPKGTRSNKYFGGVN